jgi:uncharacterized protein (TIGR03083 family)
MEYERYVDAVRTESAALASAAEAAGVDADVPSCPDWRIADLLAHIGLIQHWVRGIVQSRPASPSDHWRGHEPPRAEGRVDWFAEGAASLADALAAARPGEEVWTWTPDRNVAFWARRMAHEVSVHRWDAQTAGGTPEAIERERAVDGIQEAFDLVPVRLAAHPPRGSGETIHLHCTDGDGEWLLRLERDAFVVTNEHAKGDVAARGTASDLLLLVWGRLPPGRVEVFGDVTLLARWQEQLRF